MPQRIFDARSPCVQARQRAHGYGCTRATGGRCRFFYKNRDVYDGAFRRGSPHGHGMCVPWHSGAQRRQRKPLCTRGYAMLRSSTPQRFSRPRTLEHAILHTAAHASVSTACRCLPQARTATAHSRDDSGWHRASNMRQVLVLLGAQLRRRVPRKLPVGRLRCQWLRPRHCVTHRQHTTNGSATWQRAAALPSAGGVSSCTLGALGMLGAVVMQERSVPRLG